MSGEILQKCSAFEELRSVCAEVLDTYYKAEARPLDLLAYLTRMVVPGAVDQFAANNPQYHDISYPCCPDDCPNEKKLSINDPGYDETIIQCIHHSKAQFERRVSLVIMNKQMHQHALTCRYT